MRLSAVTAVAVVLLTPAACTRVGGEPGDPRPAAPVAGEVVATVREVFTGFVTLTGRRMPVSLELRPADGEELHGTLLIPDLEVEATGTGLWRGVELALELDYGNACAGVVSVRARREGDTRLVGTLGARDCTGGAEGPLALERRPAGTHQAKPR
ncbi:MAG: hypothetical protein AMXMBFR53_39400 [Gemmatimonadota bacterium]